MNPDQPIQPNQNANAYGSGPVSNPKKHDNVTFKNKSWINPYSLMFVLIFAGIGAYVIFNSSAATVSLTKVWNTTAGWNTGTLSDTTVSNNTVSLASSVAGATTTAGTTSSSSTTNLALNRPAYASSTNTGNAYNSSTKVSLPASNVDDGSLTTRWGSAYSDPQWIYVDLGATYNISEVKLNWEAAYAKAYEIQVSNNATTWTTIYSTTTGTGGVNDLTGLSGSGRYVRMYGTVRGTQYGYSLWEMSVYGTPTSKTTNLALNRPAYASSTNTGNAYNSSTKVSLPASNVDDGSLTTRWGSAYSDPQWIYVDLGATYNISEVKLNWEAAYAKAYEIQVSNNATTWTTIYSTTTGTGGVNDLTGLSGSGRYVRMYGTVRGTQYGYSLWEMSVYGTPTSTTPTPVATYATAGNITLDYDAGSSVSWTTLTPTTTLPSGTNITYQVRTSADNSTWSAWTPYSVTAKGGLDLSSLPSTRYIQLQADLSTTNSGSTPLLNSLTLSYNTTVVAPTATLTASPGTITAGQTTTLTWSSANTTSCTASGAWSGTEATSGSSTVTPSQTGTYTYNLACSGTGGTANATVNVTVNPASTTGSAGGSTGGCTSNGVVAPCIGSATTGATGWGKPVFDDEFSNDKSLDTTKWEDNNCPFGTNICYDPSASNVTFSGGYLNLQNNNGGTEAVITTAPGNVSPGPGFQFTYGYAEARIYVPGTGNTCDNWPSFWLDGQDWPEDGEIDIFECLDGGVASWHFHYGEANTDGESEGGDTSSGYVGWHTFAAEWESGVITYYYDGLQVGQVNQDVTDSPMFLILINGGGGGGPAATTDMQVQYVRVWQ